MSIERLEPLQTALQGTFARAMASICVHRASRTPPDSATRHIRSRDLQEDYRRAATGHTRPSELGWSLIPRFPAIHLSRQSPFYRTPRHIGSRDGIDLCPSSAANPSRQHSRAYPLARCFAGRPPNDIDLPHTAVRARLVPCPMLSCNSSVTAIAILRASRAYPLARWHRFVSIERREPLQTALQGTSARAMIGRKATGRSPN